MSPFDDVIMQKRVKLIALQITSCRYEQFLQDKYKWPYFTISFVRYVQGLVALRASCMIMAGQCDFLL